MEQMEEKRKVFTSFSLLYMPVLRNTICKSTPNATNADSLSKPLQKFKMNDAHFQSLLWNLKENQCFEAEARKLISMNNITLIKLI